MWLVLVLVGVSFGLELLDRVDCWTTAKGKMWHVHTMILRHRETQFITSAQLSSFLRIEVATDLLWKQDRHL